MCSSDLDTYNLGWKLAAVLANTAQPALLHTYSQERHAIAEQLISFDREISRMFAARPKDKTSPPDETPCPNHKTTSTDNVVDPATFQAYFIRQGRFMAGVETRYTSSIITSSDFTHQALATGYQSDLSFLGRGIGDLAPYLVMVAVLLIRPAGLFGTKEVERV